MNTDGYYDYTDNPLFKYFKENKGLLIHKNYEYFKYYHKHFQPYQGQEITLLEIGVQNGGGLFMWRNYFGSKAKIIGVDIEPKSKVLEKFGFSIRIGDQADAAFWKSFTEEFNDIDIIIDDGGHYMDQQIISFQSLFPALNDNGLYLCEDTWTSYWDGLGVKGGIDRPGTFISFVKELVDDIHSTSTHVWGKVEDNNFAKVYGSEEYRKEPNYYTKSISEISISYSMVFITKVIKERYIPDDIEKYSTSYADVNLYDALYFNAHSGSKYLPHLDQGIGEQLSDTDNLLDMVSDKTEIDAINSLHDINTEL